MTVAPSREIIRPKFPFSQIASTSPNSCAANLFRDEDPSVLESGSRLGIVRSDRPWEVLSELELVLELELTLVGSRSSGSEVGISPLPLPLPLASTAPFTFVLLSSAALFEMPTAPLPIAAVLPALISEETPSSGIRPSTTQAEGSLRYLSGIRKIWEKDSGFRVFNWWKNIGISLYPSADTDIDDDDEEEEEEEEEFWIIETAEAEEEAVGEMAGLGEKKCTRQSLCCPLYENPGRWGTK